MKKINQLSTLFGATLIETMVVLSIMAIMLNFALFHYQPLLAEYRKDTYTQTLRRILGAARAKAISSNSQITVCPLKSKNCDKSAWQQGITVFVDKDEVGVLGINDTILIELGATNQADQLSYPRDAITFRPDGTPRALNNGTFHYCIDNNDSEVNGVAISISTVGRTRLKASQYC